MMVKLLPVGIAICGLLFSVQAANAQCPSNATFGPPPANWHGPSNYQPGPNHMAPAPPPAPRQSTQYAPQPMPPANGQVAQNNQYQSFSAEPAPVYQSAPTYSYPAYGGYNGYYSGSPYYGGGYYGYGNGWRTLDNANYHGVSPNYP